MKRFVSSLGLLLAFAAVPAALRAQRLSVGAKAGLNIAVLAGKTISGQSSYARMIGGGFLVVEFSRYVAFQPELLYAQKGTSYVDSDDDVKTRIDYLEVPLLARLQLPLEAAGFRPYAEIGPTVAFKTSCRLDGESEGHRIDVDCNDPGLGIPFKSTDYGLALGGGAETMVGSAFVGLDARYVLGLGNIHDSDFNSDVKNRALGIMLGVRFPLGGAGRVAVR